MHSWPAALCREQPLDRRWVIWLVQDLARVAAESEIYAHKSRGSVVMKVRDLVRVAA